MRILQLAGFALIGFCSVGCAPDSGTRQLPTRPEPIATQPPLPPPAPPPGARRIELGSVVSDALRNGPMNSDCPADQGIFIPCRNFQVVAPADGVLRVELGWVPQPGAESATLIVGGIKLTPEFVPNNKVATQRVLAGATYGITVLYAASHFDYIVLGPDLIGEFTLKAQFER
jgi:hypothetical protein